MPVDVPWSRLIRFISAEDDKIHFGDVVVPSDVENFDVGATENVSSLTARLVTGNPLSPDCKVTDNIVKVKRLLGPFTADSARGIRGIGGNYYSHLKEIGIPPPRFPAMFPKTPNSVADYGADIEIPKIAQDDQADYEGELVVVIGKDAKNVSQEDAMDYVLGYTVGNDLSARKWQVDASLVGTFPPPQMSFAKSFDGFCPMGPAIISAKLVPDPHALPLRTKINSELRQDSSTADFVFSIPRIIEFCSQGTTLLAGSVILTGTSSGTGYFCEPKTFLKAGDKVEISFGPVVGTLVHGITFA